MNASRISSSDKGTRFVAAVDLSSRSAGRLKHIRAISRLVVESALLAARHPGPGIATKPDGLGRLERHSGRLTIWQRSTARTEAPPRGFRPGTQPVFPRCAQTSKKRFALILHHLLIVHTAVPVVLDSVG